jgi:hypothetical protein
MYVTVCDPAGNTRCFHRLCCAIALTAVAAAQTSSYKYPSLDSYSAEVGLADQDTLTRAHLQQTVPMEDRGSSMNGYNWRNGLADFALCFQVSSCFSF